MEYIFWDYGRNLVGIYRFLVFNVKVDPEVMLGVTKSMGWEILPVIQVIERMDEGILCSVSVAEW